MTGAPDPTQDAMADVLEFPVSGEVFGDPRGGERWMRATWHPEADVVVLSLWRATTCIATMRVARDDVPGLVQLLVGGLVQAPATQRAHDSSALASGTG